MTTMTAIRKCSRCPAEAAPDRGQCEEHLRMARERTRRLQQERRDAGLCPRCDEPPAPGRTQCAEHLQQGNETIRAYRIRRKTAGLCIMPGCGDPPVEDHVYCTTHGDESRERDRAYRRRTAPARAAAAREREIERERQREKVAQQIARLRAAREMCAQCIQPSGGEYLCLPCRESHQRRNRLYQRQRQGVKLHIRGLPKPLCGRTHMSTGEPVEVIDAAEIRGHSDSEICGQCLRIWRGRN